VTVSIVSDAHRPQEADKMGVAELERPAAASLEPLFQPIQLGRVRARNRVCLVATLTNYAKDHGVTQRWISFLVERARGGVGTLITELIAVDPAALAHGGIVLGFDDRNDDGFRRAADGVREAGGLLIGQLWHPGRQQLWSPVRSPRGISERPDAFSWTVPHVMSTAELRALVDRFVEVAQRLHRAGFNGVELHGAHGYLLTQLLSPWSNDRTDEFGGSVENRTRFVRDAARRIRECCGPEFVIGLKMPGDEGVRPGIDPDEARRIAECLDRDRVLDYLALSQGNFSLSLENHVPDVYFDEAHFKGLAATLRPNVAPLPVMSIGRIAHPQVAATMVRDGVCDLVGLSRALMADCNWVRKAQAGDLDGIRPSTYSNFAWGEVQGGRPLVEENNPELATVGEADWSPGTSASPKRIVVVGAGAAGLEAAWVLAARGHAVTLFGRTATVGGKLGLLASLPGQAATREVVDWQARQADRHGVRLRLGQAATVSAIAALRPQRVILATGATQVVPEGLDPADGESLRDAVQRGLAIEPGVTVLIYDLDQTAGTYAVVDAIARHARVVLVTPRADFARGVNYCSAIGVFRRLYGAGVELVPACEVVSRQGDGVTLRNVFTGAMTERTGVARLLWSSPRRVDTKLAASLAAEGLEVEVVGDAVSPRNLLCAIHEGRIAALAH
jgi:2,4-dienoyl-CoA reductase-like NADH-dependent reductase (Old Yellow Enzyme family)